MRCGACEGKARQGGARGRSAEILVVMVAGTTSHRTDRTSNSRVEASCFKNGLLLAATTLAHHVLNDARRFARRLGPRVCRISHQPTLRREGAAGTQRQRVRPCNEKRLVYSRRDARNAQHLLGERWSTEGGSERQHLYVIETTDDGFAPPLHHDRDRPVSPSIAFFTLSNMEVFQLSRCVRRSKSCTCAMLQVGRSPGQSSSSATLDIASNHRHNQERSAAGRPTHKPWESPASTASVMATRNLYSLVVGKLESC